MNRLQSTMKKARLFLDRRRHVHFLHIGKNAGSQLEHVFRQVNDVSSRNVVITCPHPVRLADLPAGAPYFFSVRDPVTRFNSAFYSRLRKGQPRILFEWTPNEKRAFARFAHANDLAESLFDEGPDGTDAFHAMKAISHCSMNQVDWFGLQGYFLELRPPVWIVRQEQFRQDLEILLSRLGETVIPTISGDPIEAHRNDYSNVPPLSDKAKANLRQWYLQDVELHRQCCRWLEQQRPRS